MSWIFQTFDALHGPRLFEIIWHILTKVTILSETEINAASQDTLQAEDSIRA